MCYYFCFTSLCIETYLYLSLNLVPLSRTSCKATNVSFKHFIENNLKVVLDVIAQLMKTNLNRCIGTVKPGSNPFNSLVSRNILIENGVEEIIRVLLKTLVVDSLR